MSYQKVSKLQSGSFSTVYKGVLTQNDQIFVALKCCYKPVLAEGQDQDPAVLVKYQNKLKRVFKLVNNEYEILNKLRQGLEVDYFNDSVKDKNICHMVDFLESSEFYIFVLQFCQFGDLYDHIKLLRQQQQLMHIQNSEQPRLKPLKFFQMINQINYALQYAHSLGIAHRDIKPENILIDLQFNIKLTDWGLSTFSASSLQQCIGTEKYLAPECFYPNCILKETDGSVLPSYITHMKIDDPSLIKQDGYDTKKSDIWSLGITCLYIFFASCPFKFAAIQHPTTLKKFRNLTKEEQMVTSLPENKNFQLYLNSPLTFVEEYYFQTLLKQESLAISKSTIHAAMNIQDDYHYPAFWLSMLPTVEEIIDNNRSLIDEKIIVILDYTLNILERDSSFRLWLIHQISNRITKSLMAVDYEQRNLNLFMKSVNSIYQIEMIVLREFVRQLMDLPLDLVTVDSIDLTQIIHNIIHIFNNQHLYSQDVCQKAEQKIFQPQEQDSGATDEANDNRQFSMPANKNTRGFSNMTLYESGVHNHNSNNHAVHPSDASFGDNNHSGVTTNNGSIDSTSENSVQTNARKQSLILHSKKINSKNADMELNLKKEMKGLNIV